MADARPEFRTTRTFDFPRGVVFRAWSDTSMVTQWFTPRPLTTTACRVDLRAGGEFFLVMRTPDGQEVPMDGRFTEVVPEEKIVFAAEVHGGLQVHTTVTVTEKAGRTELDVHQTYSHMAPPVQGAPMGWKATLDQLGEVVRALA
jgi:uncharacterized protein YndB with AHSA1/START domain